MGKIFTFLKERATEKSTIQTVLTYVVGAIGVVAAPEQVEVIGAAVIIILGWIGVKTKEVK